MAETLSVQLQRQSPLADRRLQESYDSRVSQETIEGKQIATPWVERLPIYKSFGDLSGMRSLIEDDEEWDSFIDFLDQMKNDKVGYPNPIFFNPYAHQAEAVEHWWRGKDVVVSTGTGSGKTECFLWPLLGHLWRARARDSGQQRGVKAMVLYPMNALATDQMKRIRLMFGHPELADRLAKGSNPGEEMERFFQFMLYTGRTYSHGPHHEHNKKTDKPNMSNHIKSGGKSLEFMNVLEQLQKNHSTGIDAKDSLFKDLYDDGFLPRLGEPGLQDNYRDYSGRTTGKSKLTTKEFDAELLFRHEAHNVGYKIRKNDGSVEDVVGGHFGGTPDLLFTNYSMLDYMINRPIEDAIWEDTKSWLEIEGNKLLIVLDEAHLYQGMSGLHIGHLLRRLYLTLGLKGNEIDDKIQFILTSASLGNDPKSKKDFHRVLTSRECDPEFIEGDHWTPKTKKNTLDYMVEKGLSEKLARVESDYNKLSEDEQAEFFIERLDEFQESDNFPVVTDWFEEIRDSEFFNNFYSVTGKPIRLDSLEELLWGKPDQDAKATQTLLDLFATQKGPHPGTGQKSPLVSIRAHVMTRGLPRLHVNISSDNWMILDGPQPILLEDSKSTPSRPLLLLGCRSCGAPYARAWVNETHLWDFHGERRRDSVSSILNGFIAGEFANSHPKIEVRSEVNDILERSIGLDMYLLDFTDDEFFIRGPARDRSQDRKVDGPHGWLNRYDGRIRAPWWVPEGPNIHTDWIPILIPTVEGMGTQFVDLNKESDADGPDGDIAPGSLYTFNHDSACVRCLRQYSRKMGMDQIIDYETRGDGNFASLTKRLLEIQSKNPNTPTPNGGRKILAFSDSRQRAAKLAVEIQRISNIDEFRNLLLHMLHHPWYKSQPRKNKNLASLYPDFLLHSAALGKEPLEHQPSNEASMHGFSRQRAWVVAAHLSELLKEYDEATIESCMESPELSPIRATMQEFSSLSDDNVSNLVLDEIFRSFVYSRINENTGIYADLDKKKEEKRKWMNQRSKLPSLSEITAFEWKEALNSLSKHVKDELGDSDTEEILSPRDLTWRCLRLLITEQDEGDNRVNEIRDSLRKKLTEEGKSAEIRIAKLWFKKETDYCRDSPEHWETIVKEDAMFHHIRRIILNLNAIEISLICRLVINLYIDEEDNKRRRKIFQKTYPRMIAKVLRPQSSFIGSLIRIIAQRFNSIDQIGLGYVGISEERKRKIRIDISLQLDDDENDLFIERIGKAFGVHASTDDGVDRIISLLDGMVQALVRNGTKTDRERGASCFALYARDLGFTKTKMTWGGFPLYKIGATDEEIEKILLELGANYSERRFLVDNMGDIFDAIRAGQKPGFKELNPSFLQIFPLEQSDKLLCCSICSRPHPHPVDVERGYCRWCREETNDRIDLIQFDHVENRLHSQRIERPWREPLWEINPGNRGFPDQGLTIIRAEEHTAQIGDHVKENRLLSRAIEFELLFQDIPFVMPKRFGTSSPEPVIDILSCTTTMEVGIDIGSLVAVALRTVPRDAASYQQRVGRAGRQRAQVCAALSWFDNSQYAQAYFHSPGDLLNHPEEAPKVYEFNKHVTKQHLRMAMISLFTKRNDYDPETRTRAGSNPKRNLMESHGTMDDFFGVGENSFGKLKEWLGKNWDTISDQLTTIVYDFDGNEVDLISEARDDLLRTLEEIQEYREGIMS